MDIPPIKEYRNVIGVLCEEIPEEQRSSGEAVRYCILGTSDGEMIEGKDLENISSVGIIDEEISSLWKHYWVRPKTFEIKFKKPTTCHVGVSATSGKYVLVCGKDTRKLLLED